MNHYLPILYESLFGFVALLTVAKLLGKTQISQLTAFDFISAIILGELVGNALFDEKAGILDIGFVIIIWGGLLYITEIITQKFKSTRALLEGSPAIVIHNGKLIRDVMKKNKLDINQLQHLLRSKDVFSIREVAFAILETDGTISVMRKSQKQTPTRGDLNLPPQEANLSYTIISDGEIIYDNLEELNLTEAWLKQELKKQEVQQVEEIFYAEYTSGDQNLFLLPFVNEKEEN
ncbi:DUF421 domain-containing protein [Ornithinibacillus halophilus]|uniref:Uncharacterized membrane protein YcaP, DUF421 family n=1 Tax=Ornithinibacillus halophilus TaxID=930117 RepID=A0A1M5IRQ3_9BACI|nr:DUF421 domain-containing protein [Ornithinibacillus halophilus]SHG30453.1 Uncharacterized membrane protein YcaP, DUF421 family [Ornithinibacillus halophilus]